jgi:hypothetical protein
MELQCIFVTASQLNRASVEEIEFDHSHISGGLSKIQTADNVIGIFTSRAMRERGRYQIQLMKTRSSSGVGAKIDLEFNIDCLRITDCPEDEDVGYGQNSSTSSVMAGLKRTSNVTQDKEPDTPKEPSQGEIVKPIRAETDSTKLRSFIANLGNDEED